MNTIDDILLLWIDYGLTPDWIANRMAKLKAEDVTATTNDIVSSHRRQSSAAVHTANNTPKDQQRSK
jgi:hypothetical protein